MCRALKTIFVFVFFDSDWKIVFLILYRELFVTKPGAIKICLFRAALFIHKIASKKGLGGYFIDILKKLRSRKIGLRIFYIQVPLVICRISLCSEDEKISGGFRDINFSA